MEAKGVEVQSGRNVQLPQSIGFDAGASLCLIAISFPIASICFTCKRRKLREKFYWAIQESECALL